MLPGPLWTRPIIFLAPEDLDPPEHLAVTLRHERVHVGQIKADGGLRFLVRYLLSPAHRLRYEAMAFAASCLERDPLRPERWADYYGRILAGSYRVKCDAATAASVIRSYIAAAG